jgi:hypothetical protein
VPIRGVRYQLNGGKWRFAPSSNAWDAWSVTLDPQALAFSFNQIRICCTDGSLYRSRTNTANFNYATTPVAISGSVFWNAQPMSNVTLTASNPAGFQATATTAQDGQYVFVLPEGWSGTIVPSRLGYGFQPGSRSYSDLTDNADAEDFVAIVPPITILSPLSSVTVPVQELNMPVSFSVAADGGSVSYQWLFNGQVIPGETGSTYTIPSVSLSNAGFYSVVITNALYAVTNSANLAFMDVAMFAGIIINGPIGSNYRVDYSTDLGQPVTNWTSLATNTLTTQPYIFFDLASPGAGRRFYRATPLSD